MSQAARANEIFRELKKLEMDSGHCTAVIRKVLEEADIDRMDLEKARAEITLLTTNVTRRDKQIKTLQNQKLDVEGRLERLTRAKATRNSMKRLARSQHKETLSTNERKSQ